MDSKLNVIIRIVKANAEIQVNDIEEYFDNHTKFQCDIKSIVHLGGQTFQLQLNMPKGCLAMLTRGDYKLKGHSLNIELLSEKPVHSPGSGITPNDQQCPLRSEKTRELPKSVADCVVSKGDHKLFGCPLLVQYVSTEQKLKKCKLLVTQLPAEIEMDYLKLLLEKVIGTDEFSLEQQDSTSVMVIFQRMLPDNELKSIITKIESKKLLRRNLKVLCEDPHPVMDSVKTANATVTSGYGRMSSVELSLVKSNTGSKDVLLGDAGSTSVPKHPTASAQQVLITNVPSTDAEYLQLVLGKGTKLQYGNDFLLEQRTDTSAVVTLKKFLSPAELNSFVENANKIIIKNTNLKAEVHVHVREYESPVQPQEFSSRLHESTVKLPESTSRLLVLELPQDISYDHLKLIIEKAASMTIGKGLSLEMIGSKAAVIFDKSISDKELENIITNIQKWKKGKSITATQLKSSNCIFVSNIDDQYYDEQSLLSYFENQKRSGGGAVESVKLCGNGKAMIVFQNQDVAASVVSKGDHSMYGYPLVVQYISTEQKVNKCKLLMTQLPSEIETDYRRALLEKTLGTDQISQQNTTQLHDLRQQKEHELHDLRQKMEQELHDMRQQKEQTERELRDMRQQKEHELHDLRQQMEQELCDMRQQKEQTEQELHDVRQQKEQTERELRDMRQQNEHELHDLRQQMEQELHDVRQQKEHTELELHDMRQQVEANEQQAQRAHQRATRAEQELRLSRQQAEVQLRGHLAQLTVEDIPQNPDYLKSSWRVQSDEIQVIEERPLGVGGWGEVRVALFRGMKVAAKFIHEAIISPHNIDLFIREMNMAACVRHPNLLLFIGASLEKNKPIIITELMQANLRSILLTLLQDHVISIGTDVACALNYLHLTKPDPIIHRDVSSANVLLEPIGSGNWKAKVSDYGSANFVSMVTTKGPGNASYAAPESSNPKFQSPKMDVYSYGILLLEMATGQFPDHKLQATRLKTLQWQEMAVLIRRCICEDPAGRIDMKDVLLSMPQLN